MIFVIHTIVGKRNSNKLAKLSKTLLEIHRLFGMMLRLFEALRKFITGNNISWVVLSVSYAAAWQPILWQRYLTTKHYGTQSERRYLRTKFFMSVNMRGRFEIANYSP